MPSTTNRTLHDAIAPVLGYVNLCEQTDVVGLYFEIWRMRKCKGCLVFLAAVFCLHTAHAQSPPNPTVDASVRKWYELSKGSVDYLAEKGSRLKAFGQSTRNCDTLRIAHTLLLHAYLDASDVYERPEFDTLACSIEGFEMMREEGVYEFMFGDLDRAKGWFERCLPLTDEPKALASLATNIGTCHYLNNELEDAVHWYEASTKYGIELLSAISIMNLASVSMALGDAQSGLKWAEAAETRLLQQLDEGLDTETFVRQRDLILLNRSLAHLELGQIDHAIHAYDRLKLDDFLTGVAMEFYHLAVALAFALDSPQPIERHERVFSDHLAKDSLAAVARFGPALLLLEPWKTQWMAAEELTPWKALRRLPSDQLPELVEPGRMANSAMRDGFHWGWTLACVAVLLGAGAAFASRRVQAQSEQSTAALLAVLRSAILSGDAGMSRAALRSLLVREAWAPLEVAVSLSAKEQEVLIGIKDGERAKETAQRLDLSVKRIYTMRSELKRKLELSDNDSIEEWVNKQIPGA